MNNDIIYLLIHLILSTILINCSIFVNTTSRRISATYPGQFQIGILLSVHQQPVKKKNRALECGEIREHYGIQRIEATFKTIDEINNDPTLLKNITLGVDIRNSCWYAPIALQQTIELIRESISPLPNRNQQSSKCYPSNETRQDSTLIGIIGPASSSIALQVQNLLQLFSIPQIGYSTTSKDLSDKNRFSSFMRVISSDYYQAQVMVDIVKRFNFTYVSAVNTNENYGQSGIQAFRELAEENNICIAKEGEIQLSNLFQSSCLSEFSDSILSNADEEQFEEVLHNLNEDLNANVVICFCEGLTVRGLLKAMNRLNMTERFLIIGSDGWADRQDVVVDFEKEALGAITIRIHSPYVNSFDNYYFGLSPFENKRNPWFKEFWQKKFHCRLPDSNLLNFSSTNDTKICTGKKYKFYSEWSLTQFTSS
jgi:metabotropic glutamate receptor 1